MEERIINEKRYLVWEEEEEKEIETVALGMLEQNDIRGLLPFRLIWQEERQYFRYEEADGISLAEWLLQVHDKKEVLAFLKKMADVKEEIEAYLLEEDHLCTEPESILVQGNECRMAYIPCVAYREGSILKTVRYILENLRYAMDEDYTYVFELLNAFSRGEIGSCAALRKWIRMFDEGSGKRNPFPYENLALKEDSLFKADGFPEKEYSQKENSPLKKEQGKLLETEKKGLFGLRKKTEKRVDRNENIAVVPESADFMPAPPPASALQGQYMNEIEEGETVFLGEAKKGYLVDRSTGKEYPLERNESVIGSDVRLAEICMEHNSAVSRRHAKIYCENEMYEIEDLNSTNGTYVNGEKIAGGERRKLENGTRIKLANEEFVFELRRY